MNFFMSTLLFSAAVGRARHRCNVVGEKSARGNPSYMPQHTFNYRWTRFRLSNAMTQHRGFVLTWLQPKYRRVFFFLFGSFLKFFLVSVPLLVRVASCYGTPPVFSMLQKFFSTLSSFISTVQAQIQILDIVPAHGVYWHLRGLARKVGRRLPLY